MENINPSEKWLKIVSVVIPFIVIAIFNITLFQSVTIEGSGWEYLTSLIAICLGIFPLLIGKVAFPHGKVITLVVYAAAMYILLMFFSMVLQCWIFGQCS